MVVASVAAQVRAEGQPLQQDHPHNKLDPHLNNTQHLSKAVVWESEAAVLCPQLQQAWLSEQVQKSLTRVLEP